jgi:hypothetical protein
LSNRKFIPKCDNDCDASVRVPIWVRSFVLGKRIEIFYVSRTGFAAARFTCISASTHAVAGYPLHFFGPVPKSYVEVEEVPRCEYSTLETQRIQDHASRTMSRQGYHIIFHNFIPNQK